MIVSHLLRQGGRDMVSRRPPYPYGYFFSSLRFLPVTQPPGSVEITVQQHNAVPPLPHDPFRAKQFYPLNAARAASARRIHSVRSP